MPKKKDYDKLHRKELDSRSRRVQDIIDEARRKAAAIAIDTGYDGEGDFFFDGYATARKRMESLMKDTASKLTSNITEGITAEWQLSALKMSAIVEYVGKFVKIPKRLVRKLTDPMDDELEDFTERRVTTTSLSSGRPREMTLSERVWNLSGQFKQELELAVEEGMSEGIGASELSRKVRKYLNEPEKLFRRVRMRTGTDEDGKPVCSGALRLSKAAQAYHPGTGVYRSSYMNAVRMTVTEINTAYRTADYLRWKSTPFILGIEIRITASRHVPDICDDLKGKYPKDFKFTGWHPWCRCYAVPVLPSPDEFKDFDMDAEHHEGEVTDVPQNFKNWVGKNEERIEHAKTMPNFLKDNEEYWKGKEKGWKEKVDDFISSRRKEYERLVADPLYKDVAYDEKSGGVKATHIEHNVSKSKGSKYENIVQEIGYQNGHSVILGKEDNTIQNLRNTDGKWDGLEMEIAGCGTGTANNIRNGLKHCAKKGSTEVAILLLSKDAESFEIEQGLKLFAGLKGHNDQWKQFKEIIVISERDKTVKTYHQR